MLVYFSRGVAKSISLLTTSQFLQAKGCRESNSKDTIMGSSEAVLVKLVHKSGACVESFGNAAVLHSA